MLNTYGDIITIRVVGRDGGNLLFKLNDSVECGIGDRLLREDLGQDLVENRLIFGDNLFVLVVLLGR